jgi:hypothetical protein
MFSVNVFRSALGCLRSVRKGRGLGAREQHKTSVAAT